MQKKTITLEDAKAQIGKIVERVHQTVQTELNKPLEEKVQARRKRIAARPKPFADGTYPSDEDAVA